MRIGFLVWNQFQVAHTAEIAKRFDEPDFIFIDRVPTALKDFDPAWLIQYGAYARFVSELELSSLDGQYDAIVSQFRPPLKSAWENTKLVMQQYSLAKPKTAYNARWFAADLGLVYGGYSESIIGHMCPVEQVGNPRFDPFFSGKLDSDWSSHLRANLDPQKKTIVYLPTWGDLNQTRSFRAALAQLSEQFNIIMRPHHLTSVRSRNGADPIPGLLDVSGLPAVLEPGLHMMGVADLGISDMSGAIFDALYCGKPVVLIGSEGENFSEHRKADNSALEVTQRHRIGPYATDAESLVRAVHDQMRINSFREGNESLVNECFKLRGGGAELAAGAIRRAVAGEGDRPLLQAYAAPDFVPMLFSRAAVAAKKRRQPTKKVTKRAVAKGKRRHVASSPTAKVTKLLGLQVKPVQKLVPAKRGSASLTALVKRGDFFAAGKKLESWARQSQDKRALSFHHAQNAASALRLSRVHWRKELSALFKGDYAPSTEAGRGLLRHAGMLRSAEAWYHRNGLQVPRELADRIHNLGSLAGVIDVAARNEVASREMQLCITPSGGVRPLEYVDGSPMVELHLLSSLVKDLKDEAQRPYRQPMLQFSRNLVEQLLSSEINVYPRLQSGIIGATAVSRAGPAFTWHTLDSGRAEHFHLKIGTLFGHFIVDNKGYGGWSSIAETPLQELIAGVSQDAADAHWEWLSKELVAEGRSKYFQDEDTLPEDWKNFVFLPMQVSDDAVAQLAWIDTLSLLEAMIEWAKNHEEMVVVKRHPMCRDKKIAKVIEQASLAGLIHVSTANIHRLVAASRAVVTVNSGVGAEALLQLKPVITTGGSDYAAATNKARSVEELHRELDDLDQRKVDAREIRRLLWAYTKRYMVHWNDREAIRQRIQDLLPYQLGAAGDIIDSTEAQPVFDIAGTTAIPFVVDTRATVETAESRSVARDPAALGAQCDQLLSELDAAGVKCWLDSGSLLGLVRYGRLNDWEKDIDLGIWIDDIDKAREVCRGISERFSLWYREKWIGGIPYALLLSSHAGQRQKVLPISIHTFYRSGDIAWLPQPYSLVGFRAKYPRYVYRKVNGPRKAPLVRKIKFAMRHPIYSLCLVTEKAGWTRNIGQNLKRIENAQSFKDRLLMRLFVKVFQWRIPSSYFDELHEVANDLPHVLMPRRVDEYLRERYGDWRVPVKNWFYVVDDGCISSPSRRELKDRLVEASRQYDSRKL